ncbi:hypothetical protein [Mucilaginibacter pocheonensis]|uniref:Uncharacterized protein n=1 Tax=Mucilaginibacter pocheonensis TaxID=398050 RepID=A0ABU1TIT3_9SPHI|nr:hypothetical protein [Mucilaginibacter pocheonensis]MDR6945176.1 hypothetical protein [Mucilaginibacter pocheonensis]
MKYYFSLEFDPSRSKLLNDIGQAIEKYYPIGFDPDLPEYHQQPGYIKRGDIINENIANANNYQERWGSFINELEQQLDKTILSTTYGFVPGFSADLILEKYEDESLVRIKKISFAISLIGPFFSICGIDETFIKEKNDELKRSYNAINVATVSPYEEFEKDFNYLQNKIEEQFKDYTFVPFRTAMHYIKDFKTPDSIGEDSTLYNALFNHLFNYRSPHFLRGDTLYGYEQNNLVSITLPPSL